MSPSSRESSPPLEAGPPLSPIPTPANLCPFSPLDRFDQWFLASDSDAERGAANKKMSGSSPTPMEIGLSRSRSLSPRLGGPDHKSQGGFNLTLPNGIGCLFDTLQPALKLLKQLKKSAFLPLPEAEDLDDEGKSEFGSVTVTSKRSDLELEKKMAQGGTALSSSPNTSTSTNLFGSRRRRRSPLALTLPLTASDLVVTEPPTAQDCFTVYLATLALLIWAAVLYLVLDSGSGIVADLWAEGFDWRVATLALTGASVPTWAVTDDVLGIAGVCNGGVCQWTPLV